MTPDPPNATEADDPASHPIAGEAPEVIIADADDTQFNEVEVGTEEVYMLDASTQQTITSEPNSGSQTTTEQRSRDSAQGDRAAEGVPQVQPSQNTQLPTKSGTQDPQSTSSNTQTSTQRPSKRKSSLGQNTDDAIMEELAHGRRRDIDRDYTFCMNLYAELKHRRQEKKTAQAKHLCDTKVLL